MRLLANPMVIRAAIVLFSAAFAFILGLLAMKALRRNIDQDFNISANPTPTLDSLPLHLYNTVIQQLKQQKHDLEVQNQAEQRRSRTSENLSQAVLSNLSSGVIVFGVNGLAKQSNPAAKEILGYASPTGMSAEDIFRGALVTSAELPGSSLHAGEAAGDSFRLADEVHSVLREGSTRRQVEGDYLTPSGQKRHIAVTVSAVPAADGSLLGAACMINDLSQVEQIRRQQELHGEISAEMALDLRTSLATIAGYAQQLAGNRDPGLAGQLAEDISNEAARLNRSIGGFLVEKRELRTSAASAGSGKTSLETPVTMRTQQAKLGK